ncbi:protein-tyrosine phosphatase [Tamaricihabitans halophyticus]|uniref:protein-tyrosine-phosphatase n=2 Tax=Tamaricihabitans halophyticus TaxID=1262583 RepID=A0A4R2QJH4_9PSEU|nr:protein-tyrosine phosphatase [Tamaricihabitans halophyticus]
MGALIFTEHARRAGLDAEVRVTSCGIGPWHVGEPADRRAAKELAEHGYPTEHVAAQLDRAHLDADLLLAMDSGHYATLLREVDDPERVRMLRSFDPDSAPDAEVPDPYYGGASGFTDVLRMIEAAMPGLLDWVRARG